MFDFCRLLLHRSHLISTSPQLEGYPTPLPSNLWIHRMIRFDVNRENGEVVDNRWNTTAPEKFQDMSQSPGMRQSRHTHHSTDVRWGLRLPADMGQGYIPSDANQCHLLFLHDKTRDLHYIISSYPRTRVRAPSNIFMT